MRLVEPFGAGGGPDLIARALAARLTQVWGVLVSVDNRPGAGATGAPAFVAAATPDGHTLLVNKRVVGPLAHEGGKREAGGSAAVDCESKKCVGDRRR